MKGQSNEASELDAILAPKSSWKKRIVGLIVILALAGGGYYWWQSQEKSKRENGLDPYVTEALERGSLRVAITVTGNLEPTNEVTIGSELSGTTTEVFVDSNDRVSKDQALAEIGIRRLTQDLESSNASVVAAKARVSQVEATLKENQATLDRLQELFKLSGGRTPSKADMVTAEAAVARSEADLGSAKAAVLQSEASLRANESDLEKATIRSPIDGIVLSRQLEVGQTVAASFTAPELFVIAESLEQMKLLVAVAEADIGRVEVGQKATFSVDAWLDRVYEAKVTKVSFGSAIVDNMVTYEVELEVSNSDLSLRPGMTATADILVAERTNSFLVDNAAFRFDPESAAAVPATAGGAPGQRQSFVQTLTPTSRRRPRAGGPPGGGGGPRGGSRGGGAGVDTESGQVRIWVLKGEKLESIQVQRGLTDGRQTEISGDVLGEGMQIVIRANRI